MAGIAEVIASAPGAVFAVDERLRIVAWNRGAEQGLGIPAATALGARCFEAVEAVDVDTGEPCYAQCPLLRAPATHSWAHSRVLEAQWRDGAPVHLDCMLLQCVLPSSERATLSFLTPLGAADAERHLRAMSALEALSSVLTRSGDRIEGLGTVLRAVLQATSAEAAELSLLDPETLVPRQVLHQPPDRQPEAGLAPWLSPADLRRFVADGGGALVALQQSGDQVPSAAVSRWCLTIPLVAEERLLGTLSVVSQQAGFTLGFAARVLFAVGGQLSVFLHWVALADSQRRQSLDRHGTPNASLLRLYCFGQFRVVRNGQEVPYADFRRHKSLTLLGVLVARRGRPLHREALTELLWPESDPALASNNLRVVLHDLRHTLEPELKPGQRSSYVLSRGDLVYLDPSDRCLTDVEEFERLNKQFQVLLEQGASDAALEAGRAAVALYGGEYLEDEPYLDWCIAERERLRELYVNLLQRLAATYAQRHQLAEAILACRMALAADAQREETHRQLIWLLWHAGHVDEALRQYETCRRMLWQELEVSPDEQTQSLYRTVLGALQRRS